MARGCARATRPQARLGLRQQGWWASQHRAVGDPDDRFLAPACSVTPHRSALLATPRPQSAGASVAVPCIDQHRETWRTALTVVRRQPSPSASCAPCILRCVRPHHAGAHRHRLRARISRRSSHALIKLPPSTSADDRLQRARAEAAAAWCHCTSWSDHHALQRPHTAWRWPWATWTDLLGRFR